MTENEVAEFLGLRVKVQTATVARDGAPHLTTLFYVVDAGLVTFWTYARSQKVVNLRRDPRISALVEDGDAYDQLRGVSITGRAELVEDYDEVARTGFAIAQAMQSAAGEPLTGDGLDLAEAVVAEQARKRVVIRVRPDHVASWDHRKLG